MKKIKSVMSSPLRSNKNQLEGIYNFDWFSMVTKKKIKDFNNLEKYPDIKKALVPSIKTLPLGSMNTKVIINEGQVMERVYKAPNGEIISLYPNSIDEKVA